MLARILLCKYDRVTISIMLARMHHAVCAAGFRKLNIALSWVFLSLTTPKLRYIHIYIYIYVYAHTYIYVHAGWDAPRGMRGVYLYIYLLVAYIYIHMCICTCWLGCATRYPQLIFIHVHQLVRIQYSLV